MEDLVPDTRRSLAHVYSMNRKIGVSFQGFGSPKQESCVVIVTADEYAVFKVMVAQGRLL